MSTRRAPRPTTVPAHTARRGLRRTSWQARVAAAQLPLLLAKGLFVEGRLDDGNVAEQDEQVEFLAIMDDSWRALEDAVDRANSAVVVAERFPNAP